MFLLFIGVQCLYKKRDLSQEQASDEYLIYVSTRRCCSRLFKSWETPPPWCKHNLYHIFCFLSYCYLSAPICIPHILRWCV